MNKQSAGAENVSRAVCSPFWFGSAVCMGYAIIIALQARNTHMLYIEMIPPIRDNVNAISACFVSKVCFPVFKYDPRLFDSKSISIHVNALI